MITFFTPKRTFLCTSIHTVLFMKYDFVPDGYEVLKQHNHVVSIKDEIYFFPKRLSTLHWDKKLIEADENLFFMKGL